MDTFFRILQMLLFSVASIAIFLIVRKYLPSCLPIYWTDDCKDWVSIIGAACAFTVISDIQYKR